MGTPKQRIQPFSSKGLNLKQDPALLRPDEYSELTNLVTVQEGNLQPRLGNQRLTGGFPTVVHSINRLNVEPVAHVSNPIEKRYYVGANDVIYATGLLNPPYLPASGAGLAFSSVATGCAIVNAVYTSQRFQAVDYAAGSTGTPYKFFACPQRMLKDTGALPALQNWGILPPLEPPVVANTSVGSGPPALTGAGVPYTYVYTNFNGLSLAESNPCVYTITTGVSPNGHQISVTMVGSSDPQVTQLRVYRAGGSFADGIYRFVGQVNNPGFVSVTFNDTNSDQAILSNPEVETDNDPPVPSTLSEPFYMVTGGYAGGGGAPGVNIINIASFNAEPPGGLSALTPGTLVQVDFPPNQETCAVISVDLVNSRISCFFQLSHSTPIAIQCSSIAASPASIALSALDSVFLAGDPNNPQALYKSKPGQPESFPVEQQTTGIAQIINVGSPSNPIMGLAEFNGGVLSLNLEKIYWVGVFSSIMQTPTETPASRGLICRTAWCRVDNEIWYVSYDGVYSFAGGESIWRSEQIDPLFRGVAIGPYSPIDLRPNLGSAGRDVLTMSYSNLEVIIGYLDINGAGLRARYHTKFQRWSIDFVRDPISSPNTTALTSAMYVESDTGNLLFGKNISTPCLYLGNTGTTDGWVNSVTDGDAIQTACTPGAICDPRQTDKLFSDWSLEMTGNTGAATTAQAYWNFSSTGDAANQWTIPATTAQRILVPNAFNTTSGSAPNGYGVEGNYSLQMRIAGVYTNTVSYESLTVNYEELALNRAGLVTDWSDLGYPDDKILRVLNLEIDTGGAAASVRVDVDGVAGGASQTFPVTTTYSNRNVILSMPANLIGRMIRLNVTGATTNLYSWHFDFVKEPASLTFWDSGEFTFGYDGYSFLKQAWLQYMIPAPLTISFYSDGDTLFYTTALPAHPLYARSVTRFYLPSWVSGVLNKSKTHRFTLSSTTPFKFYEDGSKLEWLPCGADQRSGYQQAPLSERMGPH